MTHSFARSLHWLLLASAIVLAAAALYVRSLAPSAADEDQPRWEIPGTTAEMTEDGKLLLRLILPSPDEARARPAAEGIRALREVPALAEVLDAVETKDTEALLALFQTATLSCTGLGRSAGPDCVEGNEAVDDQFEAITVEMGGDHVWLAVARARRAFDVMFAAAPALAVAAYDRRMPDGEGGTYFLAFLTPEPFDRTGPDFLNVNFEGTGFGLKLMLGGERPVAQFSLLTEDWNPLKWLQYVDYQGSQHLDLLLPETLSGYDGVFDHLGRD